MPAPRDAAALPDVADAFGPEAVEDAPADTPVADAALPPPDAEPDVGAETAPPPLPHEMIWIRRAVAAQPQDLAVAPDGSFVLTGLVRDFAVFGPREVAPKHIRTNGGSSDGFAAGFAPDGSFRWADVFGGSTTEGGYAASRFPDGSWLVTGDFFAAANDTVVFGAGQTNKIQVTNSGGFVARYGQTGLLVSATTTQERALVRFVGTAVASDGSYYLLANFQPRVVLPSEGGAPSTLIAPGGFGDVLLARYSASGSLQWLRQMGGPGADEAASLGLLSDDGVAVVGAFEQTAMFGNGDKQAPTLTSGGSKDLFLARYDKSGNALWVKQVGGRAHELASGVARLASGDLVIAGVAAQNGMMMDETVFATGQPSEQRLLCHDYDYFVARYDLGGSFRWAKHAENATLWGHSLAPTIDGGVVVISTFPGTSFHPPTQAVLGRGEPGEVTFPRSTQFGTDLLMAWYRGDDGTLASARQIGKAHTDGTQIIPFSAASGADGALTVAGLFKGMVDIGGSDPSAVSWAADDFNGTPNSFAGDLFVARFTP
jgi:hypothetical protein